MIEENKVDAYNKKITDLQWLNLFENDWRKLLLARVSDYEYFKQKQSVDKNHMVQYGLDREVPVGAMVKFHLAEMERAIGALKIIGMMKAAEKSGDLKSFWEEINPFKTPSKILKASGPIPNIEKK